MFFKKKRELRARKFVLEDDAGNERAVLTTEGDGTIMLRFKDSMGALRLFMGLTPDGTPRIGLNYAGGEGSIQLEANDELNTAGLVVTGPTGKAQIVLGVARNGLPAIALFDDKGNHLFPNSSNSTSSTPSENSGLDHPDGYDWDSLLDQ